MPVLAKGALRFGLGAPSTKNIWEVQVRGTRRRNHQRISRSPKNLEIKVEKSFTEGYEPTITQDNALKKEI